MFLNLLLMSTSMSMCLASIVPLSTRAIAPTTDASAVLADLYSKYSSVSYSGNCLSTDCTDINSNKQYCTSLCAGLEEPTTILLNFLDGCINKSSCNIQTTAQLKPFNISINSGSCYLSAETPKVQLFPLGRILKYNGNFQYTISNKMNFVWSNLNLQCSNRASPKGPSSTVTSSCCQKLKKILFFLYPNKNLFSYLSFYIMCRLFCQSQFTSNPTSSSNENSFSGHLQFTQTVTVTQNYAFSSLYNKPLQVTITDGGVAPTKSYNFVFDAGVPVTNHTTIQTGIENAFSNVDPNRNEFSIVKAFYNSIMTTFVTSFCESHIFTGFFCRN